MPGAVWPRVYLVYEVGVNAQILANSLLDRDCFPWLAAF